MSDLPVNGIPDDVDLLEEERERRGYPPCRGCGCTDERACPEGCSWVEPDLCSECAELEPDVPTNLQGPPYRQKARERQVA